MRIGLNATCFNNRPSGAKQRFIGLYSVFFSEMKDYEFIVYEPIDYDIKPLFKDFQNVKYIKTPLKSDNRYQRLIKGLFFWRKEFKRFNFDVFENFNFPVFRGKNELSILTIHDIRGLHLESNSLINIVYKIIYSISIKRVGIVITVSQFMKNEILSFFPNARVEVINNAIFLNANQKPIYDLDKKKSFFFLNNLPEKYFLTVGHFEERKNYARLIKAISILKLKENYSCNLVIVGNESGQLKKIRELIKREHLQENIWILNNISDIDLETLYINAQLFVFPSFYEGFGIPILEAFKFKLPVILSDIEVFKEIAGNNASYFDPYDSESIAAAILEHSKKSFDKEYINLISKYSFTKISRDLKKLYLNNLC